MGADAASTEAGATAMDGGAGGRAGDSGGEAGYRDLLLRGIFALSL